MTCITWDTFQNLSCSFRSASILGSDEHIDSGSHNAMIEQCTGAQSRFIWVLLLYLSVCNWKVVGKVTLAIMQLRCCSFWSLQGSIAYLVVWICVIIVVLGFSSQLVYFDVFILLIGSPSNAQLWCFPQGNLHLASYFVPFRNFQLWQSVCHQIGAKWDIIWTLFVCA